jgi:RNA polymerase sigma-70 factor (ECF subfamily)
MSSPSAVSVHERSSSLRALADAAVSQTSTLPDADSQAWVSALRSAGHDYDRALAELHALLLRGARFEVNRRRGAVPRLSQGDVDDLAVQAADDALVAVLAKLNTYRGASRFTTWVYKFALYEAAVKVRRRSWQNREVPLEPESWPAMADHSAGPDEDVETGELLGAVRDAVDDALTPHQREVLVALAINGVPIDVLAERLNTTRGALYKTLHDARRKLRAELAGEGLSVDVASGREGR